MSSYHLLSMYSLILVLMTHHTLFTKDSLSQFISFLLSKRNFRLMISFFAVTMPTKASIFFIFPYTILLHTYERILLLRKITESKCFGFVFSALSCLFFTSNSAVFVGGDAKILPPPSPPGACYPSYATDKIIGVGLV